MKQLIVNKISSKEYRVYPLDNPSVMSSGKTATEAMFRFLQEHLGYNIQFYGTMDTYGFNNLPNYINIGV